MSEGNNNQKVFIIAFSLAALMCFAMGGLFFWLQYRVQSWPTTEGRVTSSSMITGLSSGSGSSSRTTMYSADVTYSYYVDDKEFTNDDIGAMSYSTSDKEEIQDMLKQYTEGSRVTVYFNPESPEDSVLTAEVSWLTLIPFVIGVVFIFFLVLFGVIIK